MTTFAALEMMISQFIVGGQKSKFLEFDKVYKNTKIIRLEDNYRSTQNILMSRPTNFF